MIWRKFVGWTFALILASTISAAAFNDVYIRNGGMSAVPWAMGSAIGWMRVQIDNVHLVAVLALALAVVETIHGVREIAHLLRTEQRKRPPVAGRWKAIRSAYCLILCGLALVPGVYYGLHAVV